MRTIPTITRHRRPLLSLLLIALALVAPFRSPFAASATSTTTETTIVLQTAGAPLLASTSQIVGNQLANETNPHVDCNLASYTFDDFQGSSTIHYQDLTTGIDNVIPGNEVDLLSDISGSRVAYTEVTFTGDTVRIFDTNSQTTTVVPGFNRSNPSIGANLVAFEHYNSASLVEREIEVYDLTTGAITPLTNDSLFNVNANVSPNGNAVVWEKCQTTRFDCTVHAAVKTAPGVFTTTALTTPADHDYLPLPSTNGYTVVYASSRTGDYDIYYQPVTGGTETHLAIPGAQRFPRISGDLISFESEHQNGIDIFVFDIRTGNLFQVTSTPLDERLTEISVCNDVGRILYSIVGNGGFDIHAITFAVPSVTDDQIDDLTGLVRSFNLPPGTANSLIRKLQNALDAINAGDLPTACSSLTAFKNECAAQSGKKLTPAQATQLINAANLIKSNLGCQ
jgi:hypothetical protein